MQTADYQSLVAVGGKLTSATVSAMSALPPKADISWPQSNIRFVPKAVIATYSITSSAAKRMPFGIVMPSALAVLRLTTNSNLVGCSIGSSAGFAPFRIRAT